VIPVLAVGYALAKAAIKSGYVTRDIMISRLYAVEFLIQ
jgi:hypothetical protein